MIRAFATFSCLLGFFIAIMVVAGTPDSGDVEARETDIAQGSCITREVALDEGYGITRKASKLFCADKN
jgi:hypothetical protein